MKEEAETMPEVTTPEVQIHFIEDAEQELHIIGDYVAVVFTMKEEVRKIPIDGQEFTAKIWKRDGQPYILFASVSKDRRDGTIYRDEDSPVDGGLSADEAEKVSAELARAVAYLRELESPTG